MEARGTINVAPCLLAGFDTVGSVVDSVAPDGVKEDCKEAYNDVLARVCNDTWYGSFQVPLAVGFATPLRLLQCHTGCMMLGWTRDAPPDALTGAITPWKKEEEGEDEDGGKDKDGSKGKGKGKGKDKGNVCATHRIVDFADGLNLGGMLAAGP